MANGKVIPFGYAYSGAMTKLEQFVTDDPKTMIVDIRDSPHSRRYLNFEQKELLQRFGKRYIWMKSLGNINYNNDKPIQLRDRDIGIARLIHGLAQGYTLILLCACKQYEQCHRRVVIEELQQELPMVEIVHPDQLSEPTLPCLSIQQPYGYLIISGQKDIENRKWQRSYRGPLLIHCGAKFESGWFNRNGELDNSMALRYGATMPARKSLYPEKSIIGIVDFVDVVKKSTSKWFRGAYGFVFENARAFREPIRYSGSLNLFDVPVSVVADALAQIETPDSVASIKLEQAALFPEPAMWRDI